MEEEVVEGEIVCDDEILAKIIIKLGEEKKKTTIGGMESIHPMYEALIALLRRQLQDLDISQRFIKDENSLKEVLTTDAFLSYIQQQRHKDELRTLLRNGASLQEIVHRAALYLSEDKRTKDGKVLHPASELTPKDKYFMGALSKANPREIYIASTEIEKVNEIAKKRKLWWNIRICTAIGLSTFLTISGLFFRQRISEYTGKTANLTTEIVSLEKKLDEEKRILSGLYENRDGLTQAIDEKKNQLVTLVRAYSEKQTETTKQINNLQKKLESYDERTKEKVSNIEKLVKSEQELAVKVKEKISHVEDLTKKLSTLEEKQGDIEKLIKEREGYIDSISKEEPELKSFLAEAYASLGLKYKKEGEDEKARRSYEKALNFNPDNSATCSNLGVVYYKRKEYRKAVELFEKALSLNPNLNNCIRNLGAAYEVLGNKDKALEYYQKYLELKPNDPDLEQINERVKKLKEERLNLVVE